jgi:hypothetical protein
VKSVSSLDVFFYEAFQEEVEALKRYLPTNIEAEFTWKTIQEQGDREPPASVISIRTQSVIPTSWAAKLSGILTRSTGYDHIKAYLQECRKTYRADTSFVLQQSRCRAGDVTVDVSLKKTPSANRTVQEF